MLGSRIPWGAVLLDLRGLAMNAQNGDIGTVHRAAHVQTASQAMRSLPGRSWMVKSVAQSVHDTFHDAGCIRCRRVAVDPSLRVDDIADRIVRSPDRKAGLLEFRLQRLDVFLIIKQELHVIATRKSQIATAVFVCQIGKQSNCLDAQKPWRSRHGRNRSYLRFRIHGTERPGPWIHDISTGRNSS